MESKNFKTGNGRSGNPQFLRDPWKPIHWLPLKCFVKIVVQPKCDKVNNLITQNWTAEIESLLEKKRKSSIWSPMLTHLIKSHTTATWKAAFGEAPEASWWHRKAPKHAVKFSTKIAFTRKNGALSMKNLDIRLVSGWIYVDDIWLETMILTVQHRNSSCQSFFNRILHPEEVTLPGGFPRFQTFSCGETNWLFRRIFPCSFGLGQPPLDRSSEIPNFVILGPGPRSWWLIIIFLQKLPHLGVSWDVTNPYLMDLQIIPLKR